MKTMPDFPVDKLTVVPWPQAGDGEEGLFHDSRSLYVERFWLGVLGPSTTLLLRHLNTELETSPVGFVMHYSEVAAQMGVNGTGKHSPFMRSLQRLCQFNMAEMVSPNRMAVRQSIPTLSRRHVSRLPMPLQQSHDFYLAKQLTAS